MSRLQASLLLALVVAPGAACIAKSVPAPAPVAATHDAYAWLEEITGDKSMAWVRPQNEKTRTAIAATSEFQQLESSLRAILDSDARIPGVVKMGPYYYNFWQDAKHERGIMRRTTLDEYRKHEPKWETILDIDALNQAENEHWVFAGMDCLRPEYQRCLIELSRGGADATVTREFDLPRKQWVKDGFFRPEAKGSLRWIDRDTVYVATDFGAGSTSASGYPRIVKRWMRGTPMASAAIVYEGQPSDMSVGAFHDHTPGYARDFVERKPDYYSSELYLRGKDGTLTKVDVPSSVIKSVVRDWLTLTLREPWTTGGKTYEAGSLLATNFDAFMAGKRQFEVLFAPTERTSLANVAWTRRHLILSVREDVKSKPLVLTPSASGWKRSELVGVPKNGTVSVSAVDRNESDQVWLTATDQLTPTTLSIAEVGEDPQKLKSMPAFFDGSKHVVEQLFATSKDGTRVPYFIVRPRALRYDGSAPTLLFGYGGFEISLMPRYLGTEGKAWLERAGVYVTANIRGGGEYGPRWHQAALKANRHRAYEDFAAVAQDLIARKITSPSHLGIQGVSNGGLLTGNMLVQYPELFGAVAIQVPLLDMQRYSHLLAGASWMAEYGDPDNPEEWAFIRTFSPYHLFDEKKKYPPVIITTSTRDDRVHPGHARKMAAKMIDAGKDVLYYENVEGGHGGAANNKQQAYMDALVYTFLWQRLTAARQ